MRTIIDPFSTDDQLVDKLLGNSYNTICLMLKNIEVVQHVSEHLQDVFTVSNNIAQVLVDAANIASINTVSGIAVQVVALAEKRAELVALAGKLNELMVLHDNLPMLQVVHDNRANIIPVGVNILSVLAVNAKLAELMLLHSKLPELQVVHDNLAMITPVSTNIASVVAVNGKLTELMLIHSNLTMLTAMSNSLEASLRSPVILDTGTSRLLGLDDSGAYLRRSNAAASTITVAPQASVIWTANTEINLRNGGVGQITLVPGAGVTINAPSGGGLKMNTNMAATLKRVSADVWDLLGQTAV